MEQCQYCDKDLPDDANLCPHCGHWNSRVTSQPFTSPTGDKVLGFLFCMVLMYFYFIGLIIVPILIMFTREKRPQFCSGLLAGMVTILAVALGLFAICITASHFM